MDVSDCCEASARPAPVQRSLASSVRARASAATRPSTGSANWPEPSARDSLTIEQTTASTFLARRSTSRASNVFRSCRASADQREGLSVQGHALSEVGAL